MKPIKQLIERNLKFSNKYAYLGITRGSIESGQFWHCDNCGKLITNMVSIGLYKSQTKYVIGTDCADTLVKANCMYNGNSELDYQFDVYCFNQASRVATELRKGKTYTDNTIWIQVENDKGKTIEASKSDMLKYYPELLTI